jgi:hypothetical protein
MDSMKPNINQPTDLFDLVYRLRKRAEIRRQIPTRKSVQEGRQDRLADLLEEAALEIERLMTNAKSSNIEQNLPR